MDFVAAALDQLTGDIDPSINAVTGQQGVYLRDVALPVSDNGFSAALEASLRPEGNAQCRCYRPRDVLDCPRFGKHLPACAASPSNASGLTQPVWPWVRL